MICAMRSCLGNTAAKITGEEHYIGAVVGDAPQDLAVTLAWCAVGDVTSILIDAASSRLLNIR